MLTRGWRGCSHYPTWGTRPTPCPPPPSPPPPPPPAATTTPSTTTRPSCRPTSSSCSSSEWTSARGPPPPPLCPPPPPSARCSGRASPARQTSTAWRTCWECLAMPVRDWSPPHLTRSLSASEPPPSLPPRPPLSSNKRVTRCPAKTRLPDVNCYKCNWKGKWSTKQSWEIFNRVFPSLPKSCSICSRLNWEKRKKAEAKDFFLSLVTCFSLTLDYFTVFWVALWTFRAFRM